MKLNVISAGIILALGADVASAAIAFTGVGQPPGAEGEVVFEIWNGVNASRSVDTGITVKDLIANPTAFDGRTFNVGDTSAFQTATSQWLVWGSRNDGGFSLGNVGFDGTQPGNITGVVATSNPATPIVPGVTYNSYNDVIQPFAQHAQDINSSLVGAEQQNWSVNLTQNFTPSDAGFFGNIRSNWQSSLQGDTAAPTSVSTLSMYFLTTSSDGNDGIFKVINPGAADPNLVGTWTFSGSTVTFKAPAAVPVPAAIWLLGSALTGLMTFSRRGRKA